MTGASGFIGRHVLRSLQERGIRAVAAAHNRIGDLSESYHDVVAFDIHAPGPDPYRLLGYPDVLIHLAWRGLPDYGSASHVSEELPAHVHLMTTLVDAGLSSLLVSGTCMEYGMQEGELSEDIAAAPANPYALAKNGLRLELDALRARRRFDLTWTRIFYLYGPGQAKTSLYSQLATAHAMKLESLDMSSGQQLRDYLPVETAAAALVGLACQGANHGIVNVCSGRPIAVRDLAERLIHENGWTVRLNPGARAESPYEPRAFWGSRAKLDRCLHYGGTL